MAGKVWRRFKEEDDGKAQRADSSDKGSDDGRHHKFTRPFRKLVDKVQQHRHQTPSAQVWPVGSELEVYDSLSSSWLPGLVIRTNTSEQRLVVESRTKDGALQYHDLPWNTSLLRQRKLNPAQTVIGESTPVAHAVKVTVHFADRPPSIYEVTPYANQYSVRPSFFDFDAGGNKIINQQGVDMGYQNGKAITPEELRKLRPPPTADWNSDSLLADTEMGRANIRAVSRQAAPHPQQPQQAVPGAVSSSCPAPGARNPVQHPPPQAAAASSHTRRDTGSAPPAGHKPLASAKGYPAPAQAPEAAPRRVNHGSVPAQRQAAPGTLPGVAARSVAGTSTASSVGPSPTASFSTRSTYTDSSSGTAAATGGSSAAVAQKDTTAAGGRFHAPPPIAPGPRRV